MEPRIERNRTLDFAGVSHAANLGWRCFRVESAQYCQLYHSRHSVVGYLAAFVGFAVLEAEMFVMFWSRLLLARRGLS